MKTIRSSSFSFVLAALVATSTALAACIIDPNQVGAGRVTEEGAPCPDAGASSTSATTATEVAKNDAGEGDAAGGDLCVRNNNRCQDNGCSAAGGRCKAYGTECACVRSQSSVCTQRGMMCQDNGCGALGGVCEWVGDNVDCVCVKHRAPATGTFELLNGPTDALLVYTNGTGTCAGMSPVFEEPAKITVTDGTIAIVSPGRERVGQIDPDGAFYVRDGEHDYVGKLAPDGTGTAEVVYTGEGGCTMTYGVAVSK